MSAYYFVDFENVHNDGVCGSIPADSVFYIFSSEDCIHVTKKMQINPAEVHFYKVQTGSKNALDFQLTGMLGYVIKQTEGISGTNYIIVSKDTGYDAVVSFWKKQNILVKRIPALNPLKKESDDTLLNTLSSSRNELVKILSKAELSDELLHIYISCKTLQDFHVALDRYYKDSKKASEIYKKLKPLASTHMV